MSTVGLAHPVEISGSPGSTDAVPKAPAISTSPPRACSPRCSGLSTASAPSSPQPTPCSTRSANYQKQIGDNLAAADQSQTPATRTAPRRRRWAPCPPRTVNGQTLSADVVVTTITGNAGTATALQTVRNINGSRLTEPQTSRSMPLIQHLALRHRAPLRQRRRFNWWRRSL